MSNRKRAAPSPLERQDQKDLVDHIRLRLAPDTTWFAIANERDCSPQRGRFLKEQGVRAGMTDLFFVRNGFAFGLELKRLRPRGTVTEPQKVMHAELRLASVQVAICYGLDQALAQLQEWSIIR